MPAFYYHYLYKNISLSQNQYCSYYLFNMYLFQISNCLFYYFLYLGFNYYKYFYWPLTIDLILIYFIFQCSNSSHLFFLIFNLDLINYRQLQFSLFLDYFNLDFKFFLFDYYHLLHHINILQLIILTFLKIFFNAYFLQHQILP